MQYREALKIMGFTHHPSQEELKKQYRKLSKMYHPDTNKTGSDEMFKKIKESNELLKKSSSPTSAMVLTHESIFNIKKVV